MQFRQAKQSLTITARLPHQICGVDKVCRLYRKKRRGASVVEFAVVAPVFFLLVFGMIEYGRMVMVQQVLTNGTREGARRAVLDGATTSGVKTAVVDYLHSSAISTAAASDVTVSPDPPSSAASGDPVTVSVSIAFTRVSWLPAPFFLGGKTMQAQAVMRRESVQ
jgi:Flp pilus assembly protein TadG